MRIDGKNMMYYFSSKEKYEQMPKMVYHYCSLQTFTDIISNSTIRLSNIMKSNDIEEIRYIMPFLEKAINIAVKDYNMFVIDEFKIKKENITNSLESIFNELSVFFYVICFSEVADLVDQWARYADHAKGIAIGFSTDEFVKLQTTPYIGYTFSSIVYDANLLIKRMVKTIKTDYEEKCVENDDVKNYATMLNLISKLSLAFLHHAPIYKNPAFSQEREWRLIFNPFGRIRRIGNKFTFFDRINEINTYRTSNNNTNRSQIKYKVIEEGCQLTSFIDFNFDVIKNDLIKEIIIENQSKLTSSDMDLILFLKSKGYNITHLGLNNTLKISKSTIPYNK